MRILKHSRIKVGVSLISVFFLYSCSINQFNPADVVIELNEKETFQTIHNFGASDAWSCQFVGKNWPLSKKDSIANWLFSTKLNSDGSPIGIGLSCWRFNIGAGSIYQINDSIKIKDEWRRAESFLYDGVFNTKAQQGQRWFLQAAKYNKVDCLIGFVNSPPVDLTENGQAYSSNGMQSNLPEHNYPEFADFLLKVHETLKNEDGIHLDYISPLNEPQWDWKGGQEGSPWKNSEIAAFTKILDQKITTSGINVKIELAEAGKITYLNDTADKKNRGDQMNAFWNNTSPHHIANLKNIAPKVAAHSYFTTFPDSNLIAQRRNLNKLLKSQYPEIEYWMTEYCILENNKQIKGGKKDLGMNAALYMAKVIHADLVEASASAWQWWTAISPYNYKDGLVYIDKDKFDGAYTDSKMLWSLGNYSRFIRPGSKRIGHQITKGAGYCGYNDLLISSYSVDGDHVVVVINQNEQSRVISINDKIIKSAYLTDEFNSLKYQKVNGNELEIVAKSVTTIIVK